MPDGTHGGWIRPVNSFGGKGLSKHERECTGGGEPHVLDVVDVPLLNPQPKYHQEENWLIDPKRRWYRVSRVHTSYLDELVDPMASLWTHGGNSADGLNDRVPLAFVAPPRDSLQLFTAAPPLRDSLRLIKVAALEISVHDEGFLGRKVRGRFQYNNSYYNLSITDPECKKECRKKPDGEYQAGEKFLTISLGEPFNGYCYKLIASVIQPD